jgi:hypothetical protein
LAEIASFSYKISNILAAFAVRYLHTDMSRSEDHKFPVHSAFLSQVTHEHLPRRSRNKEDEQFGLVSVFSLRQPQSVMMLIIVREVHESDKVDAAVHCCPASGRYTD